MWVCICRRTAARSHPIASHHLASPHLTSPHTTTYTMASSNPSKYKPMDFFPNQQPTLDIVVAFYDKFMKEYTARPIVLTQTTSDIIAALVVDETKMVLYLRQAIEHLLINTPKDDEHAAAVKRMRDYLELTKNAKKVKTVSVTKFTSPDVPDLTIASQRKWYFEMFDALDAYIHTAIQKRDVLREVVALCIPDPAAIEKPSEKEGKMIWYLNSS